MAWEKVHEETIGEFTFIVSVTPEDTEPDWDFESEGEKLELFRKINNGLLLWFCVRVECLVGDVVLGNDYLGGCCYESIDEFISDSGYYADMKESSKCEAIKQIKLLSQIAE